jgi:hypothetical protein
MLASCAGVKRTLDRPVGEVAIAELREGVVADGEEP